MLPMFITALFYTGLMLQGLQLHHWHTAGKTQSLPKLTLKSTYIVIFGAGLSQWSIGLRRLLGIEQRFPSPLPSDESISFILRLIIYGLAFAGPVIFHLTWHGVIAIVRLVLALAVTCTCRSNRGSAPGCCSKSLHQCKDCVECRYESIRDAPWLRRCSQKRRKRSKSLDDDVLHENDDDDASLQKPSLGMIIFVSGLSYLVGPYLCLLATAAFQLAVTLLPFICQTQIRALSALLLYSELFLKVSHDPM